MKDIEQKLTYFAISCTSGGCQSMWPKIGTEKLKLENLSKLCTVFSYFFTSTDNFKKGDFANLKNEFKFDTSG